MDVYSVGCKLHVSSTLSMQMHLQYHISYNKLLNDPHICSRKTIISQIFMNPVNIPFLEWQTVITILNDFNCVWLGNVYLFLVIDFWKYFLWLGFILVDVYWKAKNNVVLISVMNVYMYRYSPSQTTTSEVWTPVKCSVKIRKTLTYNS